MFLINRMTGLGLMTCIVSIWVLSGCVAQNRALVVPSTPTCATVMEEGLSGISDSELSEIMDQALADDRVNDCWLSLIERCLNERREIPHRHLAKAVKAFNRRSHEEAFHMAMYRYFDNIAAGKAEYRDEERALLETYCRHLIADAVSARDKNLEHTMLLCRKVDRDLYSRLFE